MPARLLVLLLFLVSGATGLVYEVVWTRQLGLVFGVTIFAASAVLAAYMAGLAIGSWLFGRWIDRATDPARVYAWLEIGVGVSALLIPFAFSAIEPLYVALARAFEGQFLLFNLSRAVLAALPLLVPTTLMGGTVPAIGRFLVERADSVGWNVGLLYGVNTAGAVLGCLAAGFVFVPELGLATTTGAMAAVNIGIGAVLLVVRRGATIAPLAAEPEAIAEPAPRGAAPLAIAVFGLSGVAALGYEVVWTRVLVVYVHNTTYAFSLMLAVFLLGLALGNALLVRFYDRIERPLRALGWTQVGVALSVVLAAMAYSRLPVLTQGLLEDRELQSFAGAVALMAIRAGLVLLPSTLLLGMAFPLVARIASGDLGRLGRGLGAIYAANTIGAVIGALGSAFLLIPWFGLRGTLVGLSALSALLGAACLLRDAEGETRGRLRALAAAAATLPALLIPGSIFYDALDADPWKLVYYHEGVTDTTGVWELEGSEMRYITYGDQRGTAGTMTNSVNRRMAHLAHLLHPNPERSLQIGFGVGNTLAAAELHPEVKQLDCVELSPHVRQTAPYFPTNEGVLERSKVDLIVDDGRNFLLRTRHRYQVMTLEPPEIFTAEVVNLYTSEFYELAARVLSDDGLMLQWIPTYAMGEREARMLTRSATDVFPYVYLFYQGRWNELNNPATQLLLIGSMTELRVDPTQLARRMEHPAIRDDLASVGPKTPVELLALSLSGPERTRRWVADVDPVIDDFTQVDFSTPRLAHVGFGFGSLRLQEPDGPIPVGLAEHNAQIMKMYRKLREPIAPLIVGETDPQAFQREVNAYLAEYDRWVAGWIQRLLERG